MAKLYAISPNGSTSTIQIETMNIQSDLKPAGWTAFPNGLIIQWGMATPLCDGEWHQETLPLSNLGIISVAAVAAMRTNVVCAGKDATSKILSISAIRRDGVTTTNTVSTFYIVLCI